MDSEAEKKQKEAEIHATTGAALLKMGMRDPDSFKLESTEVIDGTGTVCYQYRARNGFDGMNRGGAVLTKDGIFKTNEEDGFTKLWNKECVGKSGTQVGEAVQRLLPEYDQFLRQK